MYTALLLALLGLAAALIITGALKKRISRVVAGISIAILTFLFFWFLSLWGEMLWFESIGFRQRFWTVVLAEIKFLLLGAASGWFILFLLTCIIHKSRKYIRRGSRITGACIGGIWGLANWDVILKYQNHVLSGMRDPIIGKDTGFYLFVLPFYDALYTLLFLFAIVALVAAFISTLTVRIVEGEFVVERLEKIHETPEHILKTIHRPMYICGAALLFVLAWGKYLNRFHLMYSPWGVVAGPGWTDVHIRLPAYGYVVIVTAALGFILLVPPLGNGLKRMLEGKNVPGEYSVILVIGFIYGIVFTVWITALGVIPGMFQWLLVEPNEITLEKQYIQNNIHFTRYGFGLHNVEEREYPVVGDFTKERVLENKNLFENVRLWDRRALDAVYKQFQGIRLYYEFVDVDDDRYHIGDSYRQVMVSAREMEPSNLPPQSQTFVNTRFKYTHGYGITLTTVSEFTPDGLPLLLVKDIPTKSEFPELIVEYPQIYYGELTKSHVVANSSEKEFDYPSREQNVYTHYHGKGGVRLANLWRKFLFGWKFDGTRLFFSAYPTPDSRIMFHRRIHERLKTIAPFLQFDADPYIVLADGKLFWIVDAYTDSSYFPYSEPFFLSDTGGYKYSREYMTRHPAYETQGYLKNINYIRNSVKVVVDAYNGTVDMYIFNPDDPVIQVWNRIFPELFKRREEIPKGLLAHVRYPKDFLLIQGLVYAKYHMSDPEVFYNQEDLWVRATEKYYGQVQPVEPYYIMWEIPGQDKPEFVLILPFTPKERQVLIGWIAGMCDPENYGRFLAYKFTKEKRVLGPQQFETKIDQDRFLSGQLTLWDQRGSRVIRGNVLAIPIDTTLIYVEPIYLQAETAAYPEMRLVVVMHEDNFSYAESLDKALEGLFRKPEAEIPSFKEITPEEIPYKDLAQKANDAFEDYLRFLGEKRFEEAAQSLKTLQKVLQQLLE